MQTLLDRLFLNRQISLCRYLVERSRVARPLASPACVFHEQRPALIIEDRRRMPLCGPCAVGFVVKGRRFIQLNARTHRFRSYQRSRSCPRLSTPAARRI
jgi:hypothetical protein